MTEQLVDLRAETERSDSPRTGSLPLIGIGALAKATSIPVETIRTWERRYGVPAPRRTDGGHRLYHASEIEHLALISRALDAGHRAAQATKLSIEELRALTPALQTGAPNPGSAARLVADAPDMVGTNENARVGGVPVLLPEVEAWIACVRSMNRDVLEAHLEKGLGVMGVVSFLEHAVGPFLKQVGLEWASGRISEAHEHAASETVRDFLSTIWRRRLVPEGAATVLFTTLPGEHHSLGLGIAAATASLAGVRILFIGRSTPIPAIVEAAAESGAKAVVVSVSLAMETGVSRLLLSELRRVLPPERRLVAGGAGAPLGLRGVDYPTQLEDFIDVLSGL
jgi:DNA-binding transcriptional MerR regulator